ncbi:MAG: histidinol dehydrogenase [Chloroflexota bacterium]
MSGMGGRGCHRGVQAGHVRLCESDDEAVQVSDDYAAEHLEIQTRDPGWYQERLRNYGSHTTTVP